MSAPNIHATALILGDRGVLVAGRSGAGKTRLAFALVREAERRGRLGRIVADDQVLVSSRHGRLVAQTPPGIAGLCEVRGLGPVPVPVEPACVVDLLVRLVPPEAAPRLGEGGAEGVAGCLVPLLLMGERDAGGAALAVMAVLFGRAV